MSFVEDVLDVGLNIVTLGGYGAYQQAGEAKKANRAARRAEEAKAFRERVNTMRQQRLATASIQNQAAVGGVGNSTGAVGQAAAIQTNTSANLAFASQLDALRQRQLDAQQAMNRWGMINNITDRAINFGARVAGMG